MWKSLKKSLSFMKMGCCGSTWQMRVSDLMVHEEEGEEAQAIIEAFYLEDDEQPIMAHISSSHGMTLGMALAAERQRPSVSSTAKVKALMTLFEEIGCVDERKSKGSKDVGMDVMCRICLKRNDGAAFIPCGHSYCRICSRDLQLNRGRCPLCNRRVKDILDLF